MANTITVSARLGFSPNAIVGYSVAPFYDQYVDVGDFVLSSNIATYINTSSTILNTDDSLRISVPNVGYTVPAFYNEYVDVGDFVLSSNIGTYINTSSLYSVVKPITILSYENIPVVTYVVTDGSPILLVSVFNTQYWSTS